MVKFVSRQISTEQLKGTALSFRDIRPPRPFDMLLSLKCTANKLFDARYVKKSTTVSINFSFPLCLET